MERIPIRFKKEKFFLKAEIRKNFFRKLMGLMFKSYKNAKPALFIFKNKIRTSFHTFFCFFPIAFIFLDENFSIINVKIKKPFSFEISSEKSFKYVIEIPLNKDEHKTIIKNSNLSSVVKFIFSSFKVNTDDDRKI
ncbi:hypothetical protein AUJ10_03005 [Candidatus Pacearchaeota archaeon CG1_02_31_27]|nr:MAG: hypothetical protein AUJ10_03005 [Candidatus Pacearchaeota archaeon CG1_02_31_27]PIN92057.1 MAG: hypothetical protein COU55_02625 [Candidatus Pacearchaeota archaeon CG10_big_fil_rev_8_21_14_0_10_31_59]PIZ81081.1 MAG: hypothetical protein COX99_00840 [Candidatus Pacearchaeota archaeon CG_4_10_14_0_2_um_filter_31_10]